VVNARAKGKDYESLICKEFTTWWNRPGCVFQRTSFLQTLSLNQRIAGGDLVPVIPLQNKLDTSFPFSVECKKDESWDLVHWLKANPKNIFGLWWKQCTTDAVANAKSPLLIFSRNNAGSFVVMKVEDEVNHFSGFLNLNVAYSNSGFFAQVNDDRVHILPLSEFFRAWIRNTERENETCRC
jgi:hypothetical protein